MKEDSMAAKPLPDQALLLKLLRYEPESGKLYWREREPKMFSDSVRPKERLAAAWNAKCAGHEAFTALSGGYRHGAIFGDRFRAHRVIWMLRYGFDPEFIDHINGDRADNRLCNLRNVSRSENNANLSIRKDSPHGVPGIVLMPGGRWCSRITKGGAIHHLGTFPNKDEAIAARRRAEIDMGFHANHYKRSPK
jgi:HNH endonuclease